MYFRRGAAKFFLGALCPLVICACCVMTIDSLSLCSIYEIMGFGQFCPDCARRAVMATDPKVSAPDREVSFSVLERQHAHRAMALYIKSLERSRANELHGSDIYRFRTLDIGIAEAVKQRLA